MSRQVDIPLECSICNKTPTFSDISHLLTHVSSKSHLSQRFKLQIASQTDLHAKHSLEVFDRWYQRYGLEKLLSERMSAKQQKRSKRSRRPDVKRESPAPAGPRMHLWTTRRPDDTPTMDRVIPGFDSETKLKGVFWPGMDLFDSATDEMKRKRNQRKDGSVLEQMKLNSLDVEPTELVFESDGQLRKLKQIFDDSSTESSPIKSESSPKRPKLKNLSLNYEPMTSRLHREAAAAGISPLMTSHFPRLHVDEEQFQLTAEDVERSHAMFQDENSPARTESPERPKYHGLPGSSPYLAPETLNPLYRSNFAFKTEN